MNRIITLILTGIALTSCTTTEQANQSMTSRFVGVPVDSFFMRYGPPASTYRMTDGRMMYLWAEHPQTMEFHGVSTATVTTVGNTAYVTGWNDPHSSVTMECQVRIVASRRGLIQDINAQYDTIGFMQTSRCNEIFGR